MAPDGEKWMLDLDEEEREILAQGLFQWGGPANPTEEVARVIGFATIDALQSESQDLLRRLRERDSFTVAEWRRMIASLEINFVSDVWGAGVEWPTVTGFPDTVTIAAIRRLQRKIPALGPAH